MCLFLVQLELVFNQCSHLQTINTVIEIDRYNALLTLIINHAPLFYKDYYSFYFTNKLQDPIPFVNSSGHVFAIRTR